jgi:Transmembrane amino acid transporter protein
MQGCGLIFLLSLALQLPAAQAFAYSNRSPTQPLWRSQLQHSKPLKMSSGAVIVDEPGSTAAAVAPPAKYSSVSSSSLNLLKNCVGAGVFSLNSRILSVSTNPMTIVPASFLVVAMALWASYNFFMVGETCRLTDSSTYAEAWSKSVSSSSQWIVQTFLVIAPIVSCLASSIVLTDIFTLVLRLVGLPSAVYGNRNLVITLLASVVLYPLCILKDLTALRSVSVFGIFGHMAAMAALGARVLDKSYFTGGRFYNAAAASAGAAIQATTGFRATASKWLVLASLLSYCFVAHYNVRRHSTSHMWLLSFVCLCPSCLL